METNKMLQLNSMFRLDQFVREAARAVAPFQGAPNRLQIITRKLQSNNWPSQKLRPF